MSNDDDDDSGQVLLSLSRLLLEHFSSFLRFHPNPKKIFRVFVDRLLETLLELLVFLHLRADSGKCGRAGSLLRVVEDVLSNGLFHPVHVSGFLSLKSSSAMGEARELEGINESYHRHFFKQLGRITVEKKAAALSGFGYLLRLFVTRAKARKDAAFSPKGISSDNSEQAHEASKPLFKVFMHLMEPLLLDCKRLVEKGFVELGEATELRMVEAHCTLKSINEMLLSFIQEKIYTRMEDTSEGLHFNFLKEIYEMIISISGEMYMFWVSTLAKDDAGVKKILPLIGREVVLAIGYFLEIEYKVLGEDLVNIWLLMFSYLAASLSCEADKPRSLLTSEILNLGCRLIHVYSELRRVDHPIFAMCRAVRLFRSSGDAGTVGLSVFVSAKPLSCQACLKSVRTLVCSQEFRLSISNAIKSIPEGQASGCIQQMNVDITDSLEWMKISSVEASGFFLNETNSANTDMLYLDMQAELLGRILSEIYAILLEFVIVTATNSVLIGNSVKNLVQILRPSFSNLVQNKSGRVDMFFSSVTGVKVSNNHEMAESRTSLLAMSWVCVFFFRMYTSCRNLYRQSISLMPPKSSRKAAIAMGNLFPVSCGIGWTERPESMDEGYFSWILKPSISLPDVIKSLSDDFLSSRYADYAPLVYVTHVMALQRLGDLNRQIKFLKNWDARRRVHVPSLDGGDHQNSNEKWKELIAIFRKEAKKLVNFMTRYLQLLASDGQQDEAGETKKDFSISKDAWDSGVCSLNEALLPTAVWRLLCQNTNIWCVHASNKSLKKFLSHLFDHLLPCGSRSCNLRDWSMGGLFCQKVTMHHISSEFLSDMTPYEQTDVSKHFASVFCRILKILSPLLLHPCPNKIDLSSLPDWSDMLGIFEMGSTFNKGGMPAVHGRSSLSASDSLLSNFHYHKQTGTQSLPSFSVEFKTCEDLLSFLCKTSGVFMNLESMTLHSTYVINLERLIVSNLLSSHADSSVRNPCDLLSLFKSCRRVMKYMVMASAEGNSGANPSSFFSDVFNSPSSVLWLLKSVSEIVGLPHASFRGQNPCQLKEIIFSMMDHTSCVFLSISKFAISRLINEKNNSSEQDMLVEADQHSASLEYFDAWKYVDLVAEILKEQIRHLMCTLKNSLQGNKLETCTTDLNWNKLSSVISCFQGFMWGLASGLDDIYKVRSTEISTMMRLLCVSKCNDCIVIFEEFLNLCLNILLIDCNQETEILCTAHNLPELNCNGSKIFCYEIEHSSEKHSRIVKESERAKHSASYYGDECKKDSGYDHTKISSAKRRPPSFANSIVSGITSDSSSSVTNAISKIDLSMIKDLKGPLLQGLLKGESPHIAFTLKELFMASAAILNLTCMLSSSGDLKGDTGQVPLRSSSMSILLGTSHLVLLEMANMVERPDPFCFVWLDGMLKYLEVVGSIISSTDPILSKDVYAMLIDTHLRAIGKCISLQGKAASLSSHETRLNTKMLSSQNASSGCDILFLEQNYSINTFKARLRMSFKKLIRRPHKFYLKTVIQALERALVGLQQNFSMVYEINTGNADGGNISSVVAAGIDCLDLILESVSGQKHVLEKNMPSLIDAIFNIVLHLQNPRIFYLEKLPRDECEVNPDAGSVILMCIEVLTKVAGWKVTEKYSFHISQFLHIPSLFKNFRQLRVSHAEHSSSIFFDNQEAISMGTMHHYIVDRQFSINLYASCCILLCTTLKHQKRKVEQCIALLQASVGTLLSCLETVNADLVREKGYFAWEVHDAIECATSFRRIYEEIRQQKDVLGRFSYYFLSTYISIYSGCGPLKTGIKREVDEALRPGVYSLIDICTPADLQQLHTIMGEGPCRSTLATLLNDYRLNFQYEGKV